MNLITKIQQFFTKNNEEHQELRALLGKKGFKYFSKKISMRNKKKGYKAAAWYLTNVGLADYAINILEQCLDRELDHEALVYYFQSLMFTSPEKFSHQYLYDAYTKWGKTLVTQPQYNNYPNQLTANRRLRIGYTCHFITNSTSTTLLLPILKAHHRDRVEIFMYSDQNPRKTSNEVRNLAEHWRDIYGLSDAEFCEQVRKDQIDILLELNGHILKNRFRALTRKPAPVQVSYYNHAATTGVPGIDYFLVGEDFPIDHLQPYYSEKIFHKKGIYLATPVGSHFPPVSPLPSLKNGYITFGSFGQSHKVSPESVELWCQILKRVPNSKFYLKADVLKYPAYKSVYAKRFKENGIDLSRVILEGPSNYKKLLKAYGKVDIALDTYHYPAGTTTIEASMSGVPVISHLSRGERFSAYIGYFNLHSIGHEELLSHSKEDYVNKAVELALDQKRLLHYRHTLREDVIHSRRGDMELFTTELEEAYQEMWSIYVNKNTMKVAI